MPAAATDAVMAIADIAENCDNITDLQSETCCSFTKRGGKVKKYICTLCGGNGPMTEAQPSEKTCLPEHLALSNLR